MICLGPASRFTSAIGPLLLAAGLLLPRSALAQETDQDKAKRLYEEGQTAMKAKDYALACSRFEESYRASGIPGSLLNWADCEETRGHVGTAWNLWNEGAAKVIRDQERYSFVQTRIAAISRRVPYVRVTIASPGQLENVHVSLDGKDVDPSKPVPADPGEHTVVASADGYLDENVKLKLDFGDTKEAHFFDAPKRAPNAPPSKHPKTTPDDKPVPKKKSSALMTAGWITGGVGVLGAVGFGATSGAILGICKGHLGHCPASEKGTVNALGIVNGVSLGLGIAGLATGAVLLGVGASSSDRSSSPTKEGDHAAVEVTIGVTQLGVRGAF